MRRRNCRRYCTRFNKGKIIIIRPATRNSERVEVPYFFYFMMMLDIFLLCNGLADIIKITGRTRNETSK